MKLKKILAALLIMGILSSGLGIVAFATDDPCPWSIQE